MSEFFYSLTPERVLRAVEAFGFDCTGRCLGLNSMENRVYEVEIEVEDEEALRSPSERFRVIKFYRPGRWTKQQIEDEHQFIFDLQDAEIPVVAPLKNADGSSVLHLEDLGIFCALFPKQGGRIPDEFTDEQLQRLGRLIARMHGVGASRDAAHRLRLTADTLGRANIAFLLDGKFIPDELLSRYQTATEEICESSGKLLAQFPVQRIHGDLHIGNLLWNDTGPFLVDFDDMLVGPCVQDMWLLIAGWEEDRLRRREALVSGYEMMKKFDRGSLALIEPLRALRYIHYSAWIARRWEDPAFKRVFPHFGSREYWMEHVMDLEEQVRRIAGDTGWYV